MVVTLHLMIKNLGVVERVRGGKGDTNHSNGLLGIRIYLNTLESYGFVYFVALGGNLNRHRHMRRLHTGTRGGFTDSIPKLERHR